ncbi:5'-methylthioadenosine/S-adenosylhomocysteine nucleosidase [Spirillospora sp. NBC_00431]
MSRTQVSGILTMGGTTNVHSSAVGDHPVVNVGTAPRAQDAPAGVDVGIITILDVETDAVRLALDLREDPIDSLRFYTGEVPAARKPVTVAAIRALDQGQRSAILAYDNLCAHHDPTVVVLAGIGGGLHKDVRKGDVVVATRVVYYDLRKETPDGTQRRGEERHAPAGVGHAVNAFFTDHHPGEFSVKDPGGTARTVRFHHGPIASGDAVVADRDSGIVRFLAGFNDKILAVDMEAAGVGQACHERSASTARPHGWVVVRGISDDANPAKNDDHHGIASWHAAVALKKLIPYLVRTVRDRHAGRGVRA